WLTGNRRQMRPERADVAGAPEKYPGHVAEKVDLFSRHFFSGRAIGILAGGARDARIGAVRALDDIEAILDALNPIHRRRAEPRAVKRQRLRHVAKFRAGARDP